MASESKEVETDLSPVLKVYKDGTVERFFTSPYVPPSLDDPITHVSSKDIRISSEVSARIYLPKITDPICKKIPILVYFHGGGFCLGSAFAPLEHRYLNQLVSKVNAVTISVEYRLAPEHSLPAAYEDCWTALQWVASNLKDDSETDGEKEPWLIQNGDFDKVYLGGDSAGGISNPLINPLSDDAPDLSRIGCRKVLVCCAEKDELRDINLRYVEALKESNWEGEVELADVEGEGHCFQFFDPCTEKAQSLISNVASFITG
ncbi:OLC1v1020124C1 [Oldenlandia corymbosa var. corymbosa]|uniref:OLC1v1020124C1 n=1 Tax=Oldenlandia corymbosa var. corymbosa TaxID=529605 RepID=A0AAV1EFK4_OLDCO|nr:OLC1v1020124C1 [Oldenlandia corymbosa var. corymbosa]